MLNNPCKHFCQYMILTSREVSARTLSRLQAIFDEDLVDFTCNVSLLQFWHLIDYILYNSRHHFAFVFCKASIVSISAIVVLNFYSMRQRKKHNCWSICPPTIVVVNPYCLYITYQLKSKSS
ncbi:hypothetical protein BX070DRAFT_228288 [Coemansia spiralis]|nr:hypothetical protein BX070DRAFT_228288 [Coemansia spiralis]